MRLLRVICLSFLGMTMCSWSQTKIEAQDGIHYITTNIDYPITGTYSFKGAEPLVELNATGTGFYQRHEQPKKAITWGIECDESGKPIFKKGFDNAAYTLWYLYSNPETEDERYWKVTSFTIHFNSLKMFIQGERSKGFTE
ncbi:hypothetical protein [Flavobacterium sp.]|uniref:hypothetical protein n=1 Tax=Flavobacterium sp. TaxID=239 RepID=UPI0025DE180D|nr:hypothetical protein [Flavobacterium sp.]